MARTKNPLLSMEASGSIGSSITFSKWKGRSYVRQLVIPANPKSGLQVGMRAGVKFLTQHYAALSATIKAHWKTAATPDNITPLNQQVRAGQRNLRLNKGVIQDPTAVAGTTPNALATLVATAAPKSVNLTWTHPGANPGNYTTMIFMSTTPAFTSDISNLVAIVPQATLAYTVSGLLTGTVYYFTAAETNTDGTIGARIADVNATPT